MVCSRPHLPARAGVQARLHLPAQAGVQARERGLGSVLEPAWALVLRPALRILEESY